MPGMIALKTAAVPGFFGTGTSVAPRGANFHRHDNGALAGSVDPVADGDTRRGAAGRIAWLVPREFHGDAILDEPHHACRRVGARLHHVRRERAGVDAADEDEHVVVDG